MKQLEVQPGITIDMPARFMRPSHRKNRSPEKIEYPSDDYIQTLPINPRKAWIPKEHLYGRQTVVGEYIRDKERRIMETMVENPTQFLEKAPIIVVIFPLSTEYSQTVIEDGHHRTRYSGRVKILDETGKRRALHQVIPSLVYSPAEMAEILNQSGYGPYTEDSYTQKRLIEVGEVLEGLDRMPKYKHPVPLTGISTAEDVVKLYGKPPRQIFPASNNL